MLTGWCCGSREGVPIPSTWEDDDDAVVVPTPKQCFLGTLALRVPAPHECFLVTLVLRVPPAPINRQIKRN